MKKFPTFLLAALVLTGTQALANPSVSEIFEKVHSSVVVIQTIQKELASQGGRGFTSVAGMGSGVLISADGKVMTAAHVVQTAERVVVSFNTGEEILARVLASEPAADVALLQLEELPPASAHKARLGDSDESTVGEQVMVVGAPLGVSHTLTVGHISARRFPNKMIGDLQLAEFLQTDAAINQGNSGGPMFNGKGEVIGLVSYIISQSGGSEGLGFAVTSNTARRLLLESRGIWSGMHGVLLSGEAAEIFNLPVPAGLLVQQVASKSLAADLGLRPGSVRATVEDEPLNLGGDVIIKVMGIPLGNPDSLPEIRAALVKMEKGESIRVTVLRAGKPVELSAGKP